MKLKKHISQIVIEVLISVALFSLVAFSIATVLKDSNDVLIEGMKKQRAVYLAKEALEGIWAISQNDFNKLEKGTWDLKTSSNKWVLSDNIKENNGFLRQIDIQDQESLGDIKEVKVRVQWGESQTKGEKNVNLSEYFSKLKDYALELGPSSYLIGNPTPWQGQSYTIAFSVKAEALSQNEGAGLFASQDTSQGQPTSSVLQVEFDGVSNYQLKVGENTLLIGSTDDKWNQVVITWDGSILRTYYNGALKSSANLAPEEAAVEFQTYILGSTSGKTNGFAGFYKNLMIFERALSKEEVHDLFSGKLPNSEKLKLFWKMDEGNGETIKDSSPYGISGNIIGSPLWKEFLTLSSFEEVSDF